MAALAEVSEWKEFTTPRGNRFEWSGQNLTTGTSTRLVKEIWCLGGGAAVHYEELSDNTPQIGLSRRFSSVNYPPGPAGCKSTKSALFEHRRGTCFQTVGITTGYPFTSYQANINVGKGPYTFSANYPDGSLASFDLSNRFTVSGVKAPPDIVKQPLARNLSDVARMYRLRGPVIFFPELYLDSNQESATKKKAALQQEENRLKLAGWSELGLENLAFSGFETCRQAFVEAKIYGQLSGVEYPGFFQGVQAGLIQDLPGVDAFERLIGKHKPTLVRQTLEQTIANLIHGNLLRIERAGAYAVSFAINPDNQNLLQYRIQGENGLLDGGALWYAHLLNFGSRRLIINRRVDGMVCLSHEGDFRHCGELRIVFPRRFLASELLTKMSDPQPEVWRKALEETGINFATLPLDLRINFG